MACGCDSMSIPDKSLCTGCAACYNACATGAISMLRDADGFLYPSINKSRCIGCEHCTIACPMLNLQKWRPVQIPKDPLCGCAKDEILWRMSTSGGAFSCICNSWKKQNPIVFGARFDGVWRVVHDLARDLDGIATFRGSKYVQSEIQDSYRKCRDFLSAGRCVIFSGTPCQIAGLRSFLGRSYEKLLTVDFICHGVGSPLVFNEMLRRMGKRLGSKVIDYRFRSKFQWPQVNIYSSEYSLEDGRKIVSGDEYCSFFLNRLCMRKSCGECRFKSENRCADITLGDSRGESQLYPDKDDKNWSVIVANTVKGREAVAQLHELMRLEKYPIELLHRHNPSYFESGRENPRRDEFFRRFQRGCSTESLLRLCGGHSFAIRFCMRTFRYLLRKIKAAPHLYKNR